MKRCLFIGRFQPFHEGHLHAIKKLLRKYDEIVIVIGSSEDLFTRENPFSCGERIEMIRLAFTKSDLGRMITVPVRDVNDNTMWVDHLLMHIPPVDAVYSNNQLVKLLFSKHGILVDSLDFFDRGVKEGVFIRKLLTEANPEWKKHVSPKIVKYLLSIGAEKRLKKLHER
ncbi:nicotinamide-nucleotide adenylyltransferase [Candidatus Micrarchaeota archaeon]|nr:nicotinamide-nucleotide adenylyltransferase [Candidatus Micrarchaeota archaeon]